MQSKRHDADYDPWDSVSLLSVQADIVSAKKVIADFERVPAADRITFAAWLCFNVRK